MCHSVPLARVGEACPAAPGRACQPRPSETGGFTLEVRGRGLLVRLGVAPLAVDDASEGNEDAPATQPQAASSTRPTTLTRAFPL